MSRDPLHDLFERTAPDVATSAQTRRALDDMRPGFERSRRRHRRRVAVASTAAAAVVAGGIAALAFAGASPGTDPLPVDPRTPATSTVGADEPPGDVVEDAIAPDRPDTGVMPATPSTTPSTTPSSTPSTTTAPAVAAADQPNGDTDVPTSIPVAATDPVTGTTPGGSITVTFDGATITVESIDPVGGFTADLRESEPDKVKVYFDDGTDEFEVEIKIEDGQLRVDAEQADTDDSDD